MLMKFLYRRQKYRSRTISINGKRSKALIADTLVKKAIGLMFRASLPESTVMLFDFGYDGKHGIWMRNMHFPIDAIWLSDDLRVVSIKSNIGIANPLRTYKPESDARYLIEANAGFASKHKIRKRDKIGIKN
jgi:uncharacterized protein